MMACKGGMRVHALQSDTSSFWPSYFENLEVDSKVEIRSHDLL